MAPTVVSAANVNKRGMVRPIQTHSRLAIPNWSSAPCLKLPRHWLKVSGTVVGYAYGLTARLGLRWATEARNGT
jgi:hypothetical protein